jgi:hypothetical protein
MLEKAARAIQVASTTAGQKGDLRTIALCSEVCAELARAVLAAIREPDEAMLSAAYGDAIVGHGAAYTAMIDAILEGETK